jgi:Secreted repeat of unknown function
VSVATSSTVPAARPPTAPATQNWAVRRTELASALDDSEARPHAEPLSQTREEQNRHGSRFHAKATASAAQTGLDSSELGTTKRRDGSTQVTYAGHPLYYFAGDKGREITCQHVKLHGGFWYVVKPSGMANMAKGSGMMM